MGAKGPPVSAAFAFLKMFYELKTPELSIFTSQAARHLLILQQNQAKVKQPVKHRTKALQPISKVSLSPNPPLWVPEC